MAEQSLLVLSTFPDAATARKIVRQLVEEKLVACGNILPQIESIYHWQGKIESSGESLAFFKLPADRYAEFEKRLRSLHPYEVPEIVAVDIAQGLPEYLRWIAQSCQA